MKPNETRRPPLTMDDLASAARRTQEEARIAFQRGEYDRAAALAEEAQLLAEDVHEMVDAEEDRQDRMILQQAADFYAAERTPARGKGRFKWLRRRKLGAAVGTGLGMSLALAEC